MENTASWNPTKRFFKLLSLDRKDISYIYVYAVFSGLITLLLPLGIQAIIGLIAGGDFSASLALLILMVTAATAMTGVLQIMQKTVLETIVRRIFFRSAFDFTYRLPRFQLDSLTRHYPPELVNRFFDTLTLQKGIPKILIDFSTALLQILFGLLLISFYHPFFIFFGIFLLTILALIFRYTSPNGLKTSLKESKYKYEVAHWLEEIARTMSTFKLAGDAPIAMERTDYYVTHYLDNRWRHFRILIFQYGNFVVFKTLITGGLLFLGSFLVIDNQINIGQFVAAEIVIILVMNSVEKLIVSLETIYDVLTALEKIGAVTDMPLEPDSGEHFSHIDTGKGMKINTYELSFEYPGAEKPTLDRLTLKIEPGERVCIAGYNGAGRSTLIKILTGLFTQHRGLINYNDFPRRNLNLHSLRNYIGDFCADEDIFQGSIVDNITLGRKDITLDELGRISERIGLANYARRLPNGYLTDLLPGGQNVPRHIRTKVMLARSVVGKPRLLAIEDYFDRLEEKERIQIMEFLTEAERNWTLIVASNDPLVASFCQRVIVMQEGRIVAEGDFESIAASPHFAAIFTTDNK
jgi:ABC-type bacteriocin/lantibiotic exporter with double-glycine peptidase domain